MPQQDNYEIMSSTFSNPTKMGIIMLILEKGKMTVTEMAKYLPVSRSNLYHFVGQMVADGVLNEPEVVPKKNYVEKYYTINLEMFGSVSQEEWASRIRSMPPAELRSLLGSALMGYSMTLKIAADQVYQSTDEDSEKLKDWLLTNDGVLSYSSLSRKSTEIVVDGLNSLFKNLIQADRSSAGEEEISRFLVVFLPYLKRNSGEKEE